MIIYISGRYTYGDTEQNINDAREFAIRCWNRGYTPICPHLNTGYFDQYGCTCSYDEYIKGDLEMIARCDAVVMLPGWEQSPGSNIERNFAEDHNIPVYEAKDIWDGAANVNIPRSATELARPEQCSAFIDIIMRMYRLHLSKNADYSPANILGAGEVGLVTRIWDKVSRLMNLFGFKIEIASSSFEKPSAPRHESIDDTVMDLAVYAIIAMIYRLGKWGK